MSLDVIPCVHYVGQTRSTDNLIAHTFSAARSKSYGARSMLVPFGRSCVFGRLFCSINLAHNLQSTWTTIIVHYIAKLWIDLGFTWSRFCWTPQPSGSERHTMAPFAFRSLTRRRDRHLTPTTNPNNTTLVFCSPRATSAIETPLRARCGFRL